MRRIKRRLSYRFNSNIFITAVDRFFFRPSRKFSTQYVQKWRHNNDELVYFRLQTKLASNRFVAASLSIILQLRSILKFYWLGYLVAADIIAHVQLTSVGFTGVFVIYGLYRLFVKCTLYVAAVSSVGRPILFCWFRSILSLWHEYISLHCDMRVSLVACI